MSELSAALRQFASRLEEVVPGATMCTIVVSDDKGYTKTTYIGRLHPTEPVAVTMMARGIQQMVERSMAGGFGSVQGSTH